MHLDSGSPAVFAVVIGDDRCPEWVPYDSLDIKAVPVQYCRLCGSAPPFQRAIHLAAAIASSSRVLVTALKEHRPRWEPYAWFVPPSRRFVRSANASQFVAWATAILSVYEQSPSNVIVIIPARSYVAHEAILREALGQVVAMLRHIPEGIATLGMIDIDNAVDEDYLVPQPASGAPGLGISGIARRPTDWVARHLRRQGALVASGIQVGYAYAFAAHLARQWPGVATRLTQLARLADAAKAECSVPTAVELGLSSSLRNCARWDPWVFKQRVFTVSQCGWSGLKSPHEVARIADFLSKDRMYRPQQSVTDERPENALPV